MKDPNEVDFKVVIPFRDRGLDANRQANLDAVMLWWWAHGVTPVVQSDGLEGDAQFNRHKAYNLAVSGNPDVDVFVFSEADMFIPIHQIEAAIWQAFQEPGLVVPFTQYRYLSEQSTILTREDFQDEPSGLVAAMIDTGAYFEIEPESTMENGTSIGAVNVVSRETLEMTGGFTEATEGNWYDDRIIEEGFAFLAAPTRFVQGPALHLYHLPGHSGDHLTAKDRWATQENKRLLIRMRRAIRTQDKTAVRSLMAYRKATK